MPVVAGFLPSSLVTECGLLLEAEAANAMNFEDYNLSESGYAQSGHTLLMFMIHSKLATYLLTSSNIEQQKERTLPTPGSTLKNLVVSYDLFRIVTKVAKSALSEHSA